MLEQTLHEGTAVKQNVGILPQLHLGPPDRDEMQDGESGENQTAERERHHENELLRPGNLPKWIPFLRFVIPHSEWVTELLLSFRF
jgi:hypothetical protein